jgi:hypothetical protein
MRWPFRRRTTGGRLPSLGQDYGEAHRRYVERLEDGGEFWLQTKPFSVPPGYELRQWLRTFTQIVDRVGLGVRAEVLRPFPLADGGQRSEPSRVHLARSLSPGASVGAEIRMPRASLGGRREVGSDLVREGIAWFAEYGSRPPVVPLTEES